MRLTADPRNPAQYFAACGLYELAASRLPDATACWTSGGLNINGMSEDDSQQLIRDFAQAELVPDADWTGEETVRPYVLRAPSAQISIAMDWWERPEGGNSFWKCFGGKQKSTDASRLLAAARALCESATPENLFQLNLPLTGRLGFDPRSAWNAIDVGFSPNDLDNSYKATPTYPFAELLAAIAIQRWPFRPQRKGCTYCTWRTAVPLALARIHAIGDVGARYTFLRASRGQGISSFTYSRPTSSSKENRP
jgi:CRISPR-associated protein Csx14